MPRFLPFPFKARSLALLLLSLLALGAARPALAQTPATPAKAALDASLSATMDCAALGKADLSRAKDFPATILSSKLVEASGDTHAYCAVTGYIEPQIQFEVRLPTTTWNGRYFQVGCGGFCGFVNARGCGDMLARDFVVAANNLGHVGAILSDPLWGADPQLRRDYAGRATHATAVVAKRLVALFYKARPAYSYFRGCSTGGREGLYLAQHQPDDFDGIIAGDPAFAGRLGAIANTWAAQHLFDRGNVPVFDTAALALLHSATIKACDGIDGLKDGIIMDPRACHFDPAVLLCKPGQSSGCLSAKQIAAAKANYDGPRNSKGERLVPGGMMPGSEGAWGGDDTWTLPEGSLRYLMFDQPRRDFDYHDFNWDTDMAKVRAQVAQYDPVPPGEAPDLAAFHAHGGRLILYHGWADQGVTPLGSLDYYSQVAARLGGMAELRDWFRVFMVPGMFHCRGGDAPNTFDFIPAIMAWVEQGHAPDGVIATQREGDAVKRTRPLYAYPAYAKYDGKGSPDLAANWHRVMPARMPDDRIDWIWGPGHD